MTPQPPTPPLRLRPGNAAPVRRAGRCVLYWMTAQRRTQDNPALQHAVARAQELGQPLLVLEPLRCGYRWASDRLHAFVLQGMAANQAACAAHDVAYYPYVEPEAGAGRGLLAALARDACLVVADEYPCFFLPRMLAAAGRTLDVALEVVDGCGVLPLRAAPAAFPTAYAFRRFLQRQVAEHLRALPVPDPLAALPRRRYAVPDAVQRRWPAATAELLRAQPAALAALPIDHSVVPVAQRGGADAGQAALAAFLATGLARYGEDHNQPLSGADSGLSPYLHFGHVSAQGVTRAVLAAVGWSEARLGADRSGKREGFWGVDASTESFLDELITWRELGYGFCWHRPDDYDRFDGLPAWAQATLRAHQHDPRPRLYTTTQLAQARTHDAVWNAAQRQLVREGRIHNYLRMLWGKKILEWSPDPEAALGAMIELNNRYALDGRDPNSYTGITWVLGRFDRAWGPERPIYGTIRYMTSDNTARKLRLGPYLERYGPGLFSS